MAGKTINDKLLDGIKWAIECYEVAALPPAINYAKRVDVSFRDDVNGYSRMNLLNRGIDAKYALNNLLAELPRFRARVLFGWITYIGDDGVYYQSLTGSQQHYFKRDRKTLRLRIKGEYRPVN